MNRIDGKCLSLRFDRVRRVVYNKDRWNVSWNRFTIDATRASYLFVNYFRYYNCDHIKRFQTVSFLRIIPLKHTRILFDRLFAIIHPVSRFPREVNIIKSIIVITVIYISSSRLWKFPIFRVLHFAKEGSFLIYLARMNGQFLLSPIRKFPPRFEKIRNNKFHSFDEEKRYIWDRLER